MINFFEISDNVINSTAKMVANGTLDRIPCMILNSNIETTKKFLDIFNETYDCSFELSKTCVAGLLYLKKKL